MALRNAHRLVARLCNIQLQQPAASLDRCLGAAAARSCGATARASTAAAASGELLWSRSLHSSAQLRADDTDKDVEAANEGEVHPAQTFAYRPPAAQQQGGEAPLLAHPRPTASGRLTHVDKDGRASMVNVGKKLNTQREAVASARVLLGPEVYALVASNAIAKGDVLTVAELAGIMAAKHTSLLIPLCHNISLTYVDVKLKLVEADHAVTIRSEVRTVGPTGVEMEALTAASTAALTIYDMCKAVSRRLVIEAVVLESKAGGKSGTYHRADDPSTDKKG